MGVKNMVKTNGPDLLVLNPGTNKEVYGKLARMYAAIEPPFIAGAVASYIRENGHSVELLDANVEGLTYSQTAERVRDINPGLVAAFVRGHQPSASSQLMGAVGDACNEIKGLTGKPIFLSGLHPSALPERTLREESGDFVSFGEEHQTLLGLLGGALKSGDYSKVPGLCYLDEGNFVKNKAAPLADLDRELTGVAWDLIPSLDNYRAHNWHSFFVEPEERQPYGAIYTSLGCPFSCSFCNINVAFDASSGENPGKGDVDSRFGGDENSRLEAIAATKSGIRNWNMDSTKATLDYFAEQGVRHVKIIDEMFVLNGRHVNEICDYITDKGYDFNIWAYARIDTVKSSALLDKMKGAGINWLALGIESANTEVRHGSDKKFGNEDVFKNVQRVHDAGINIVGNYMVGLRGDTKESMRQTLDMAKELNTLWFNVYGTMAYPGTTDYLEARKRGIELPGDEGVPGGWTAYSHHSWYTLPQSTEQLSSAEVLRARDDAFHEYFTNPSYISSVGRNLGPEAVAHLRRMTKHKIPRRLYGDPKPSN